MAAIAKIFDLLPVHVKEKWGTRGATERGNNRFGAEERTDRIKRF